MLMKQLGRIKQGICILKGDGMFIENVHRSADVVCSRDTPCWRAKSSDITDINGGKVPSLLSGYKETNIIHNSVLENVSNK
jgi:hypothetical protein